MIVLVTPFPTINHRLLGAIGAINNRLLLGLDEALIQLIRLRRADGEPVGYLESFLPFRDYHKLLQEDFTRHSLYDALEKFCGVRVEWVHREIEAISASFKEAELMECESGRPLCLVSTLSYADRVTPVELTLARYRGDRNVFSVDLHR